MTLLSAVTSRADADRDKLLATFRKEFIAIEPGKGAFPTSVTVNRNGKPVQSPVIHLFSIAKYEVPQNLYQAVTGNNPSRWKGPRNSVEMVDWDQAVVFCQKATILMRHQGLIGGNQEIRLPTELEWEYCCRAGTTTAYSFGDEPNQLGEFGWFTGNAAGNDPPVGAKKPNPWGVYDVHGYLWEWCSDSIMAEGKLVRALRGGGWTSTAEQCRSDSRRQVTHKTKEADIGFRCVLSDAPVASPPPQSDN